VTSIARVLFSRGVLFAYYQNAMHYTVPIEAYRPNVMFLNATFYARISERRRGRVGQNAGKKVAECCRIFGFDSPSRQFIFNALSLGSNRYQIRWHCNALQIVNMRPVYIANNYTLK